MRTVKKRAAGTFLALLFAAVAIAATVILPVSAAGDLPRLVDLAGLLSDSDALDLSDMLDEISERQQVDIVVVTVDSLEGESAMAYADDFYDDNGYGFGEDRDGVLLLIGMEERDWYISTTGYGITAITDAGLTYISDIFLADLRTGDYGAAFTNFATLCDDFITQAKTGEPYDVDNPVPESFGIVENFVVMFGIAFIVALIVTGIMKGQLKTVRSRWEADNYVKKDGMQLTEKGDLFLYSHVDRKKRVEINNSDNSKDRKSGGSQTHISSSGTKHGGGGGKF